MIFELLEREKAIGKHSAIPTREIARELRVGSVRELREIAAKERLSFLPVLACQKGYYLPENQVDISCYVKKLRGQAAAINEVADALEKVDAYASGEKK